MRNEGGGRPGSVPLTKIVWYKEAGYFIGKGQDGVSSKEER